MKISTNRKNKPDFDLNSVQRLVIDLNQKE